MGKETKSEIWLIWPIFIDDYCSFYCDFFHENWHIIFWGHGLTGSNARLSVRCGTEQGQSAKLPPHLHNFLVSFAHWSVRDRDFDENQIRQTPQEDLWRLSKLNKWILVNKWQKSFFSPTCSLMCEISMTPSLPERTQCPTVYSQCVNSVFT